MLSCLAIASGVLRVNVYHHTLARRLLLSIHFGFETVALLCQTLCFPAFMVSRKGLTLAAKEPGRVSLPPGICQKALRNPCALSLGPSSTLQPPPPGGQGAAQVLMAATSF